MSEIIFRRKMISDTWPRNVGAEPSRRKIRPQCGLLRCLFLSPDTPVGRTLGRHVGLIPRGHVEPNLHRRFARGAGSQGMTITTVIPDEATRRSGIQIPCSLDSRLRGNDDTREKTIFVDREDRGSPPRHSSQAWDRAMHFSQPRRVHCHSISNPHRHRVRGRAA